MGILDKIMFWKKQDEFSFDNKGSLDNSFFENPSNNPLDSSTGSLGSLTQSSLGSESQFNGPAQSGGFEDPDKAFNFQAQNQNRFSESGFGQKHTISPVNYDESITQKKDESNFGGKYENKLDIMGKDIEILSAKIDMLKSSIETINQKINSLVSSLDSQNQEKEKRYRW